MPEILEHPHPTVDITKVGRIIRKLHNQVAERGQRVHVTRAGCDDICVLISQKELQGLEQALAIFADTRQFQEMCANLQKLLRSAGVVYAPAGFGQSAGESTFAG